MRCRNREGWRYYDAQNGYADLPWFPTCRVVACPDCIRTAEWQARLILGACAFSRYAVFTLVHPTWQENRKALAVLFRRLDRLGYNVHAVYTIERNPKETGWHLNLWWWGPDVPREVLRESALAVGWGERVNVKRWTTRDGQNGYGTKDAVGMGYGTKDALADQSTVTQGLHRVAGKAAEYLTANGGRLFHARSGQHSPYRLGVGGTRHNTKREMWCALRDLDGATRWLSDQEPVLVNRRGHLPGSRDVPPEYGSSVSVSPTPLEQPGTSGSVQPPLPGLSSVPVRSARMVGSTW